MHPYYPAEKKQSFNLTAAPLFSCCQRAILNLLSLQAQARLQGDIKATKTIAMTIAAYFFSYVPAVAYVAVRQTEESLTDSWFRFLAWYAILFPSAVNPVICYLRSSRFRSPFKQLLNDPLWIQQVQRQTKWPWNSRRGNKSRRSWYNEEERQRRREWPSD